MKGGTEWATTFEASKVLGQSRDTLYERCRNRTRRDAFPEHLIIRTGGGYRFHRSLLSPATVTPVVRISDEDADLIARKIFDLFGKVAAQLAEGRAA